MVCLPLLTVLGACAQPQVSVIEAEQTCLRDAAYARYPDRPRSWVTIGGGGGHAFGSVQMELPQGAASRRDPSDVYNRCVLDRSGQLPTVSLYDQPGWRG